MAFWFAFAVGLAVVWLFARDQFDRRSWKDERRLARMLNVLSPSNLRGSRVLKQAFLVYVVLLTVLYVVLVYMIGMGIIVWEGAQGASPADMAGAFRLPEEGETPEPLQPWVPLAISLGIVGLAPRLPIICKIEEKLRQKAHALMGIPVELLSAGEEIAEVPLSLDDIGRDMLSEVDARQVGRHVDAARRVLGPRGKAERLENALVKLIAFKSWVLDGDWPSRAGRLPYTTLERELDGEIRALLQDLDDLARHVDRAQAEEVDREDELALVHRWETRADEARDLCAEVCALMFVYAEKEDPARRAVGPRQSIALFFERVRGGDDRHSQDLDILINSLAIAVLLAAVWGYGVTMLGPFLGAGEFGPGAAYQALIVALLFALTALFIYGPAMLTALWLRGDVGQGKKSRPAPRRNFSVRRHLSVFIVCYVVSLLFLSALNATQAIVGADPERGNWQRLIVPLLQASLFLEAPRALLGGVQGVFVARYFELAGKGLRGWRAWSHVLVHGAALFLVSALATQLVAPQLTGAPASLRDILLSAPVAGMIGLATGAVILSAFMRQREPSPGPPRMVSAE